MANIERYEQALSETERLATIVREVHHRIKNNLQGVVGLLAEHRDTTPALAEVLNGAISQLHAVAEVHNLLAHQNEEQISLAELVSAIVTRTAALCHHRLEVDIPENTDSFKLSAGEAVPFALVVNELLLNAIKHGYPDGRSGTIRISLVANGEACLRVANDGCLTESNPSPDSSGIGLQLVRALLPASCTLRLSGADGWTVAEVTLREWMK
jgi:two-component sensor histidine kinase